MGWIPAPLASTENSSAANMALVSVTATAGMAAAVQRPISFFTGTAPSSSEYSVWTRRWMNRGAFDMGRSLQKPLSRGKMLRAGREDPLAIGRSGRL